MRAAGFRFAQDLAGEGRAGGSGLVDTLIEALMPVMRMLVGRGNAIGPCEARDILRLCTCWSPCLMCRFNARQRVQKSPSKTTPQSHSSAETSSAARNDPIAFASACFRSMRYLTNMRSTSPSSLALPALQGHQPLPPATAKHSIQARPCKGMHSASVDAWKPVHAKKHVQPVSTAHYSHPSARCVDPSAPCTIRGMHARLNRSPF